MNKTRIPVYEERLAKYEAELVVAKRKHAKVSMLRLAIFIAILASWFYIFPTINSTLGAVLGLGLIIAFLLFLKVHKKLEDARSYLEALIAINKNEIACCKGNYESFDSGTEFIDHHHAYSYDIDLFGVGSLYQYINRTVTVKGKNLLSDWLKKTPLSLESIINNQQAIAELSEKFEFRQEFQVIGKLYSSETEEVELVNTWIDNNLFFKRRGFMALFLWLVPIVNLGLLAMIIAGNIGIVSLVWIILVNLTIIGFKLKQFNTHYGLLNRSHKVLKKIAYLVEDIEDLECNSTYLIELQGKLNKDKLNASIQIKQLTSLLNGLDNRNNMLIGIVLNSFLLWDWQYIFRIETWRLNHKLDFGNWLECIANFDALNSLANLKYNNPDFTFPELNTKTFVFNSSAIGHPLLPDEIRVCNDFNLQASPRYAIVTGANMAGKSTFLRTIATNLVLAGCGAPVCAAKMVFMPLPLHSSMRAEDSLMNNESYFFAELKRLQKITQALENGEKLFIILDEILRGTNSEDKRKGSIGFVKKITEKMAHGLVATHDLELARLAEQQPEIFKALCFEVDMINNELKFEYKLQPGVTQNMNASFLMKQMGIIDQ